MWSSSFAAIHLGTVKHWPFDLAFRRRFVIDDELQCRVFVGIGNKALLPLALLLMPHAPEVFEKSWGQVYDSL